MENLTGTTKGPHKILLTEREVMSVTGVEDVISFDEKQVILDTNRGRLVIKGDSLHVKRLNLEKGETDLEGNIDSMIYVSMVSHKHEESLFSRLFG